MTCHPNLPEDHCHTGEDNRFLCAHNGIGCTRIHDGFLPHRIARTAKPQHIGHWLELFRTLAAICQVILTIIIVRKVYFGH